MFASLAALLNDDPFDFVLFGSPLTGGLEARYSSS
jgi:hypothetical protein